MVVEAQNPDGSPIVRSGPYNGNGVTVAFDYDFPITEDGEISVVRQNADLTEDTLALTTDYTVSGAGSPTGGVVTLVDPADLPTGSKLILLLNMDFSQSTDYSNQGRISLSLLEVSLDRLTLALRQLREEALRSVTVDAFGTVDIATLRANIATLGPIYAEIVAVAGVTADVTTVAGIAADVSDVAAAIDTITGAAPFNPALYGALAEAEVVTGAWDFSGLIDFSNNVNLTGTNYLLFGPSDEGKIRHNGSALVLNSNLFSVQNLAGTETMMYAAADGAVQLFYDNAQKLVTYASGISITGNLIADTLSGNWVPTQAEAEAGAVTNKAMTPIRTKQAIDAQVPALVLATVLLGTLTTTSGASQTLSSLTLTSYKFLRLVFHGVSAGASGNITVDGSTVVAISGAADTFRGIVDVELVNGTFSASLANTTANAGAVATPYSGDTNLTTASTSVVVAVSTGAFDAGSIRIYGVK
jgi:hypothetical protein